MTAPQDVRRLKYAVEACVNGVWGDEPNGEDDMVVVRVADFDRAKGVATLGDSPTVRGIPESARNRRVLRPGDLLIEKSGGGEQQPVGNVVLFTDDRPAVCSNFVARMPVVANCDSRFVGYVFRALYAEGRNVPHIKQTSGIQNLDSESYLNETAWLPAKGQQESIANFLDEQTARIDALIAEKERLAERLDEYCLSAITTALSGGAHPKDSYDETGEPWFTAIPANWAFCPLNYRYEIQLGKMLDEKRITGDHLTPYLRNVDVQWGQVNVENLPRMDVHPDELERYTVRPGDLLVCEGGDVGRAAIWEEQPGTFAFQKALHRVRPRTSKDLPKYLFYLLFDSAKRGRFANREKATISHLTAEAFRRYRFPFPPLSEQKEIVKRLDAMMESLSQLRTHVGEHIARLREYRSSLISAAVTGQLDLSTFKNAVQ